MATTPSDRSSAGQSDVITIEAISKYSFAPFGDIIDTSGSHDAVINEGTCKRFNDLARLDVDSAGRLSVSIFKSQCFSLPMQLSMLERHPLASQTFIPMSADTFLVVVAPDEHGSPGIPRAFVTEPGQAINLLRGTWHGVLTPLGNSGLFAVIDRIGPGQNCDIHRFTNFFSVQADS